MATQDSNSRRHDLLTPSHGVSRKRKDRDVGPVATKPEPAQAPASFASGGNQLLAGYLAHEFLTRGTLFGQRWGSAAKPPPTPGRPQEQPSAPPLKPQQQQQQEPGLPAGPKQDQLPPSPTAYAELAYLLMTDGAHIPGVVNPTQLAQLLRM